MVDLVDWSIIRETPMVKMKDPFPKGQLLSAVVLAVVVVAVVVVAVVVAVAVVVVVIVVVVVTFTLLLSVTNN